MGSIIKNIIDELFDSKTSCKNDRDKSKIIDYDPSTLNEFEVMGYEGIDNLCFTIDPKESK